MSELRDFLSIKHGWAFKGEYFSDTGDQSILTPGNFYESGGFKRNFDKARFYIGDFPAEFVCKKDDLIVAMTEQAAGLLGSTALVPEDNRYLHNQRIGLIDCNEKMYKYFAYYLFMTKTVREQISRSSSGTKVKHTSPEKIYDVKVTVPKFQDQEKIANLLMALDQKIALNNQINEELEAMAKTLYDYWFVQFDFPDENGKPYKSSGGKMVYNDQLKREIPEGWGVKQLGELDVATGKRDANFGTENGQYDFWTTANEPIKADEYSFEGKAILIAGNGNFYINFTEGKFEAYQRTYVIQSADENELLFMYPACLQSIEKLRKGSNGSIIKYITIGDIQNISQPHCPVVAKMFVDIFRPIMNTIQKNKQQNQELTQLRDWLLPMLMNGQVKVEE
ncbi:restriction endonuclease subunit S [Streptococcus suis]|nr:restriction endonuclease subunit S [Streptococcus suis]NQO45286.1 restriction endonuclease subunit S [Streptococcus suis]WNF84764.1 restriction endonuclease subunit S [Streptococcus suis]